MHQMIGKLLKDSGWSNIITQAQVLTSGRAQSLLDEHHIKRTRYAHQVSLVNLCLLQQRSYTVYCSSVQGPPESPARDVDSKMQIRQSHVHVTGNHHGPGAPHVLLHMLSP